MLAPARHKYCQCQWLHWLSIMKWNATIYKPSTLSVLHLTVTCRSALIFETEPSHYCSVGQWYNLDFQLPMYICLTSSLGNAGWRLDVCVCIYGYVLICNCMCCFAVYSWMCVYICVCMHIFTYTDMLAYTHMHFSTSVYMYPFIYIYLHMQ